MKENKKLTWDEKFELLKEYKEEFGNCYLPFKLRYKKVNLGHWANTQRQAYKGNDKYTITQERIDKLNSIGFIWDPLEYQWNEKFELLKQYKEEFGDCNVPTKFIYKREALGTWVGRQRKKLNSIKNKNDLLKEDIEKINKLESIGFIWKKIK